MIKLMNVINSKIDTSTDDSILHSTLLIINALSGKFVRILYLFTKSPRKIILPNKIKKIITNGAVILLLITDSMFTIR